MTNPTGRTALRGAAVVVVGQAVRLFVQVGGLVVLARLLEPSDFGLVVMVTAVIGVGEVVRDFGLSSAAIQARTLSVAQRNNLAWINVALGLGLGLACIPLSFLLAWIYDDSRIQSVTLALATTFPINGFSTQYLAQLGRQMRFRALAVCETVGPVFGFSLAVIVAVLGGEHWAIVAQQVVSAIAVLCALVFASRWVPGAYSRDAPMKELMSYGSGVLGVQLLSYAGRNADSVSLGLNSTPTQLGYYDRAFQLLMLPLNQINAPSTKVALPVLSRLSDDAVRFRRFLVQGQSVMTWCVGLCLGLGAAVASPIVELALGAKWMDSAVIFQALAVGGLAQAVSYATYWWFLSTGSTRSNLHFALLTRPLLAVSVFVASFWGPLLVAVTYSSMLVLLWPIGLVWISRFANAPSREMFGNGVRVFVVCGISGALGGCAVSMASNPIVQILVGVSVYVSFCVVLICGSASCRRDLRFVFSLFRRYLFNRESREVLSDVDVS